MASDCTYDFIPVLYTFMYKEESNREERTQSQPGFPSIHLMMNLLILLVISCLGADRE